LTFGTKALKSHVATICVAPNALCRCGAAVLRATAFPCEGDLEIAERLQIVNSMKLDKILNALKTLTPREHEVLNQVVSGQLNKEIASELGITIRTVKEHRGRVMEKMEANSLAELVTMIVTARLNETRMTTQATEGTP
jgi:DNA-binding NarL/FixJ family response regulator